ncbi:Scm-like with four MBT domains protein 2 [Bulinus truncatus]|nr:Scm-like with four MBT domains protein 2 [Bulinus truncatus]
MPLTQAPLVGTTVSSIQPVVTSACIQSLSQSPVNLNQMSMEILNSGSSGAIASLPQGFCFTGNHIGGNSLASVAMVSNAGNSSTSAHLNTMPLGSVFTVTPSGIPTQIVQPISVPQQQTLTLSLNQQQQQGHQQNLPVSHSINIGQVPQNLGIMSQPIPLGQVVCSSVANANLNFVHPTLFTMSNPASQNQFISNAFNQFPFMIGNQQSIFTNINTGSTLSSQPVEMSPGSGTLPQSLQVCSNLTHALPPLSNQHLSLNHMAVSDISNNPVSLSTQPVSVFSFPSPSMSVALPLKSLEIGSQSSTDVVNAGSSNTFVQNNGLALANNVENLHPPNNIAPTCAASLTSSKAAQASTESKEVEVSCVKPQPAILKDSSEILVPRTVCARMKFTPVESKIVDVSPSNTVTNVVHKNVQNIEENILSESKHKMSDDNYEPVKDIDIKKDYNVNVSEYFDSKTKEHLPPIAGNGEVFGDLADVEDLDDTEFVWEEYLKETGAIAVPPTAFKHVEVSLQSGFSKGMKLEAPNRHNTNTYWVASVVMTCGPLLRLRFEGYKDNSSADFWSDPMTSDIHPIGWCQMNNKSLQPPPVIQEKYLDWQEFLSDCLKDATPAPAYLLDKSTGATPVDQIKEGMKLEIQDIVRPNHLWLVKIIENVGGRLYLRYEGIEGAGQDFWLFYLNERLHPVGWCKSQGYEYVPPFALKSESGGTNEHFQEIINSVLNDATKQNLPADVFNDQPEIEDHNFQTGMKLEAIDPVNQNNICPATVVEVVDSKYFIVEIDEMGNSEPDKKVRAACHRNTQTIFPVNWAGSKGIKLTCPKGWNMPEFKWSEYLVSCNAVPAPENLFNLDVPEHEFECGMKLEAVKPSQPSQLYAATITKIVDRLMWIHFDSSKKLMDSHVETINSFNLFPIGWCVSNGYQLKSPGRIIATPFKKQIAVVQPEMAEVHSTENQVHRELFGGPQIYFNHRCFSGPYLSKGRIAELPRSVGPGPITLVMKEVLSMLINTAYKSCRVLRELQLDGRPNPNFTQQVLKAKYKGKSYRAVVEICRSANQLEEFCQQVCGKLQCCPYLISPHFVNGRCPENCDQLTKTKYTYYYGKKKKKIGRPSTGFSNLDGQKKPGKRKKKKCNDFLNSQQNGEDDKASNCSDSKTVDSSSTTGSKELIKSSADSFCSLKRRYTHQIPPPSEIRTRGAKLPKYSFEKRTHKKILIVEESQQSIKSHKEIIKTSRVAKSCNESNFSTIKTEAPINIKPEQPLKFKKNPLEWSVSEVGEFLQTTDCADRELVARLRTEEIDGQALLLLTLPNVQEYMGIKLGPAIKLCHLIERIKLSFFETFAK